MEPRRLRYAVSCLVVATALAVSCSPQGRPRRQPEAAGRIPAKYEDWVLTYGLGTNEIRSCRLASEEPGILVDSMGDLLTDRPIRWLNSRSVLVFERQIGGKVELVKAEPGSLRQDVICPDLKQTIGVRGDREVLYTENRPDARGGVCTYDVTSGKRARIMPSVWARPVYGVEPTSAVFVNVARSEPLVDPIDTDLHRIESGTKTSLIASAPRTFAYDEALPFRGGLLVSLIELGGESHGEVMLRMNDGRSRTLAKHGRLLDYSPDGALLLLETTSARPAAFTPPISGSTEEGLDELETLLYMGPDDVMPRPIADPAFGYQLGRICGSRAIVYAFRGGEHRLETIDIADGTSRVLFSSPRTWVSDLYAIDDDAAVCVLNTASAPTSLVEESILAFVPLDGGPRIELDRTDSGFIDLAPPERCGG